MGKIHRKNSRKDWKLSFFFAWHNLKGNKGRTIVYAGLFLVMAVVSFLMIGEIWVYRDDRITKEYNPGAYLQQNDKRLVVRKSDNSPLTEDDQKVMEKLKYVEMVDLYDYANDVRYEIGEGDGESHFMKSSTCIGENDLTAGHLPQNRLEVVLYDTDEKRLGEELTCHFSSENLWSSGKQGCYQNVKIVGLLRKPTKQVYFHPQLCRMLTTGVDGYSYTISYCKDAWRENYYHYSMNFYPIIADDLEGNQVRVSQNYILPETDPKTGSLEQLTVESAFCGETLPIYVTRTKEENTMEEKGHFLNEEDEEDDEEETKAADAFANVSVQMDLSDQGGRFIEVSQELFDRLYGEETTQASVYITSYGKTDKVIDKLEAAGYDCISTYRVSATQYLEYKVYQRLEVLGICCIVLLVMGVLEILLLRFLLITQKRERRLLRFLGMRVEQVKKIDYQELGFPCLFLTVLTLLLFWLGGKRNDYLDNILQYETAVSLLLYFAYNGVVMVLAVILFHKKGKQEAWIL